MGNPGNDFVDRPAKPSGRSERIAHFRLNHTMRRTMALRIFLFAMAVIAASGRTAAASDVAQTDEEIQDQLGQGIALRRAGKDDAALGIFLGLEKRAPDSVRVLLHITTAALAAGRWTMAYDYLQRAAIHKDDPYYKHYKVAIDNVERTINQHVGQFRAQGSPAGAEVRLSGELIGALPMGNAKILEIGTYTLEVSKPGYFALRRPVTIAGEGSLTQEDIDLREQKSFSASPAFGQMTMHGDTPVDTESTRPTSWWRSGAVTWSLLGVGAAAGVASGIAFAKRENDAARWNNNSLCLGGSANPNMNRDQICGPTRHSIDVAQNVGIIAGIAGVAFGGAALVHWLTRPPHPGDNRAHAGCSPGLGSVACYGSF